jgi:hypothetical protein
MPAGRVRSSRDITVSSWVKRSAPEQSASVTTPTGCPSSTTITAPWLRFGNRFSASPTVPVGGSVSAVSWTGSRCLIQATTSATTSTGMSCGITASPPQRAMVSAIRRPDTAVMFAATTGIDVPVPSAVDRSTSSRDATPDRFGTRNTSLKVRSPAGSRSW